MKSFLKISIALVSGLALHGISMAQAYPGKPLGRMPGRFAAAPSTTSSHASRTARLSQNIGQLRSSWITASARTVWATSRRLWAKGGGRTAPRCSLSAGLDGVARR